VQCEWRCSCDHDVFVVNVFTYCALQQLGEVGAQGVSNHCNLVGQMTLCHADLPAPNRH
jgi:hypothetical protein